MDSSKGQFRIELTPEQKAKVRNATGKDAEAVELSVEELEERIAPRTLRASRLAFRCTRAPAPRHRGRRFGVALGPAASFGTAAAGRILSACPTS